MNIFDNVDRPKGQWVFCQHLADYPACFGDNRPAANQLKKKPICSWSIISKTGWVIF